MIKPNHHTGWLFYLVISAFFISGCAQVTSTPSPPTATQPPPPTTTPPPPTATPIPPTQTTEPTPTIVIPTTRPTSTPLPVCKPSDQRTCTALMVIAPEFSIQEFNRPRELLEKTGYIVVIAGPELVTYQGIDTANIDNLEMTLEIKPDVAWGEIEIADYDAIIFVGAIGALDHYGSDPYTHHVIQQAVESELVVGGICIAVRILANSGVLEGRNATIFQSETSCDILKNAGATCTGNPVERDGNLITAQGPTTSSSFARTILAALVESY